MRFSLFKKSKKDDSIRTLAKMVDFKKLEKDRNKILKLYDIPADYVEAENDIHYLQGLLEAQRRLPANQVILDIFIDIPIIEKTALQLKDLHENFSKRYFIIILAHMKCNNSKRLGKSGCYKLKELVAAYYMHRLCIENYYRLLERHDKHQLQLDTTNFEYGLMDEVVGGICSDNAQEYLLSEKQSEYVDLWNNGISELKTSCHCFPR